VRFFPARRLTLRLVLIAVSLTACSRDPNVRKQKYFESGQRYFKNGKFAEAEIEFANAVALDPKFADAHYQLALSYLKTRQYPRANQELAKTIELQPENYSARIEMAKLLIAVGNLRLAQEEADWLLHDRPNDAQSHFIAANLLASQARFPGAIEEIQKAIALDPSDWDLYLNLALMQLRNNQTEAAESNFKKAIQLNPKAIDPHLMLANYYQVRNRLPEAEQQLRDASQVDSKDPEPRTNLVRLYLAEGKKAAALDVARKAKQDFLDNSAGYRILGNFYFITGDVDHALVEYSALNLEHPQDLQVKKDYIQLLLQKGRLAEAEKLDGEILKARPDDSAALIYGSQIQISSGRPRDATASLQAVIKSDPANSEAHYVLGIAFEKLGDPEGAEREWREALRLRPEFLDAVRALAGVALHKGDVNALDQIASQMIGLQPSSAEGYSLRALSNISRQRFAAADADIRKAIDSAPESSFGYVQMGNLKLAQKQFGAAAKAYQAALDRNQNSTDALRGLLNTYVAQKQVDQAIAAAKTQIEKSPNNSGFYDLLGSVLFGNKKDLTNAEGAFKKSAELDKTNSDALIKLAQVQAAEGSIDQAIATCRHGFEDNPSQVGLYILLGDLYQSRRDWKEAADAYQKVLAIKPDNALASNDLASVMLESGENLDVALSLAQTARRGLPESPGVADTLGWVLYQKGAYRSAIDSLQEALKLALKSNFPDNPKVHYHLAMAYLKTGQSTLARQQIQQLLRLDPNSTDAVDARKRLAELKS